MKKIIILIALLSFSFCTAPTNLEKHFFFGSFIDSSLKHISTLEIPIVSKACKEPVFRFGIVLVAGDYKERQDVRNGGYYDNRDLLFTGLGGIVTEFVMFEYKF